MLLRMQLSGTNVILLSDAYHSNLQSNLGEDLKSHPSFIPILKEMGLYKPPTETSSGCYLPTPKCWSEFDPYSLHYNGKDLSSAEERYSSYLTFSQKKSTERKDSALPCPSLPPPPLPQYEKLQLILFSPLLWDMIYSTLLSRLNSGPSSPHLLTFSLHVIILSLKMKQV